MSESERERAIAIVVAYFPEPKRFSELLERLLTQVDEILVVDNTPAGHDSAERVVMLNEAHGSRLRIARCGENLGIGEAINIGISVAVNDDFDYLILSDQDSLPEHGMTANLFGVLHAVESDGISVGCVMPCYVDEITNHRFGFQVQRPGKLFYSICDADEAMPWIEVLSGITSGSLYRTSVFSSVGVMRENYFIDYVDTEWFHRSRAAGFRLFATSAAILYHRLGDATFPVWYFGWRPFTSYSQRRLYYRFRNFIAMSREPYVPASWKVRACWYWLGNLYAYLIFSPSRLTNARFIFRGLFDGFRGRMGRYDG